MRSFYRAEGVWVGANKVLKFLFLRRKVSVSEEITLYRLVSFMVLYASRHLQENLSTNERIF